MSDSPTAWMPLDIGAYLSDTMDLSAEYHGAYLLLIMHYWKTGFSLKNDKKSLTNVSKISWKNTQEILSRFFHISDDAWHHKRIDKELAKAHNNKEKRQNQTASATATRMAKTNNVTTDVTLNVTSLPAGTPPSLPPPKESKHPLTPEPVGNSAGVGVLKNQERGSGSRPFDVIPRLSDDGLAAAKRAAPGWDIYHLAGIYNAGSAQRGGAPNAPDKAFPAWCKSYTKGKMP